MDTPSTSEYRAGEAHDPFTALVLLQNMGERDLARLCGSFIVGTCGHKVTMQNLDAAQRTTPHRIPLVSLSTFDWYYGGFSPTCEVCKCAHSIPLGQS